MLTQLLANAPMFAFNHPLLMLLVGWVTSRLLDIPWKWMVSLWRLNLPSAAASSAKNPGCCS
jgi:hypothetical protein